MSNGSISISRNRIVIASSFGLVFLILTCWANIVIMNRLLFVDIHASNIIDNNNNNNDDATDDNDGNGDPSSPLSSQQEHQQKQKYQKAVAQGGNNDEIIKVKEDDEATDVYPSWLYRVKLGKLLGSGKYSDAFEASVVVIDGNNNDNNEKKKEYIIRFTGNWDEEKQQKKKRKKKKGKHSNEDDDDNGDNFSRGATLGVEITKRLSPHSSIPANVYYANSVPNPFIRRRDNDNSSTSSSGGGVPGLQLDLDWARKHRNGRLLKSTKFAIEVTERAFKTHNHIDRDDVLDIPIDKVKCFWRRMFEIMDYVHSKNVMLMDTKLWNFMLQDGTIVLFDWNMGRVFDTTSNSTTSSAELLYGHVSPPKYDAAHTHDVQKFGKRIDEFLDRQKEKKSRQNKGLNNNNSNSGSSRKDSDDNNDDDKGLIPETDAELLKDMAKLMRYQDPPPTMRWLLDHHDYFSAATDDDDKITDSTCILKW